MSAVKQEYKNPNTVLKVVENLDGKALAIVKKDNVWQVIVVPFNPQTFVGGQGVVEFNSTDQDAAEEQFEIFANNLGYMWSRRNG